MDPKNEKTLYRLVNPEFTFEFGDRSFEVRKANLDKAVKYQKRFQEIQGKENAEIDLVVYCIYLVLSEKDPTITEDWVRYNVPADTDALECLATLGFINQKKMEFAKKIQENLEKKLTTDSSSHI